jgi:uncharacterized protein YyaL (SSP411 family)
MAHESFEDPATAQVMNQHFVSIKVDREERPDVDAVYMGATTAMTGHGGWPMTVVLNHDAEPFFAGTYFPDRPRHGQPAFTQVLHALADAWRDRRDEVAGVAGRIRDHLRTQNEMAGAGDLGADVLDQAVAGLRREFDVTSAGFGTAPKFPPSMVLEFLLRHAARTGSEDAAEMVTATCHAMARGGMYDQVGGGFARYSVDRDWVVPHFEKMLYDNAQLLGVYARWWRLTGDPLARRVARETATFLIEDLGTAEGGFASALDADSEGVEGKFYAWTPAELRTVLGEEDGRWAADLLSVTEQGTFEHGTSTLQLRRDPDDPQRWERVRATLHAVRATRVPPARDDKVVAAWNGLAVAALAEAGSILGEPSYVDAAVRAGDLLLRLHVRQGADGLRLLRVSRDGVAGTHAGVLEDYGCVAHAFLKLLSATGDPVWLERAGALLETALGHFADGEGGFYDTADDAEVLVSRPRDPSDNASPSGHSALVHALLDHAAVTGSGRHRDAAEAALRTVHALATRVPRFAGWSLAAAEAALAGPLEIVVVGEADDPARAELERLARGTASPGAMVLATAPGPSDVPLLAGRDLVDGRAAAYVCRQMVCERPVTEPRELASLLER